MSQNGQASLPVFDHYVWGHYVFARWRGNPRQADVKLLSEVLRETRQRTGKPLLMVSIVNASVPYPTAEERELIKQCGDVYAETLEALHLAFQDKTAKATMMRIVAEGLTWVMKKYRNWLFVYKSGEAALLACTPDSKIGQGFVMNARARGWLDDDR